MSDLEVFKSLAIALALGLLVGLQREWRAQASEDDHFLSAGLRTFGLIGLLGGIMALIAEQVGVWIVGVGFAGVTIMVGVAYFRHSGKQEGIGLTTEIAALLTYILGAAVFMGYTIPAAATAVTITFLLSLKPLLHKIVAQLERNEFYATLKLLLISVVLLPLLPNQGYGPWEVFNPYEIWWMVVLIAAISFVGYFAMKIAGARHGAILTGLFGGLASSTAVTLSLSRYARSEPGFSSPLAAGIIAACATMFPRILLVAFAINSEVGSKLLFSLGTTALLTFLSAFLFWRKSDKKQSESELELQNPFQIMTALKFGALLTAILFFAKVLTEWLQEAGLYILAAVSGITDVDAITLSVSRMSLDEIEVQVATIAILIAALVNSLVKSGMALTIGGKALGAKVGLPLSGALVCGFLVWLFL